jgi:hypothetical protein
MAVKIEHRVGVQTSADAIWEIIADIESWAGWNPLYPQARGKVRIGETLTLTLALPDQAQRTIQPVVVDWTPRELLHWRLSTMGGLVRSIRYIEIEELGPANCILSNGEIFRGPLSGAVGRRFGRSIRRGFTEMGEALKDRAEAAWQADAGSPTSGTR